MRRMLPVGERWSLTLGILFILLGTLAFPALVFGDPAQVTQCNIYCQKTYTGQQLTDCKNACSQWYGATCGLDCSNCGGNSSPTNTSGSFCGTVIGTPAGSVFSCNNWCVCTCVGNADNTFSCNCIPGGVGSGGAPPGF